MAQAQVYTGSSGTAPQVYAGISNSAPPPIDPAREGVSTPPNGGEVSDVGPASDTVPMLSPEGKSGDVPFKNVDAAKQAGFKVAVTMRSPDGQTGYIPAENVQAAAAKGFQMVPMNVPDAAKASYWDALTNPVGSGGQEQGILGGALQVGGQAIKTMAQPFLHPIDTAKGVAKVVGDAAIYGPQVAGQDVVEPIVQQYMADKQQGGNALALENLGGNVLGQVEGGRVMGAAASGVEPSAALGPAGEAPVAGAEGPANTVGGANRLIPEAVRNGVLPSAWDWGVNGVQSGVRSALAGDVNAPIPGSETGLTPAQRYVSMKSVGVQPDAAEATNSGPLNAAKWLNENSFTAQERYTKAQASNLAGLKRYTDEVLNNLSPQSAEAGGAAVQQALLQEQALALNEHNAMTNRILDRMSPEGPEEGGAAVQQALLKSHADLKESATQAFKDLDSQVGDQPLPGAVGLRQLAQAILDENAPYYKLHPELEPVKAMAIVKNLAKGGAGPKTTPSALLDAKGQPLPSTPIPPGDLTYSELHRLRSDLLDFNNSNTDLVKNQANGWISQLAGAADQAITSGEGALTPDQLSTFRNANEAWKYMKATYDNPSHPFYHAVRNPSPSTLVNGTAGIARTPELVKTLQDSLGPEGIGPIQRGVAEKLLGTSKDGEFDFKNFQSKWNKLPDAYREALFTPDHIAQFEDLANRTASNPFYDPQNVLYKAVNAQDPSTLVRGVVNTPEAAKALQAVLGPKGMGPIQRGVVENALRSTKEGGYNFKTFQGAWNKLDPDYRDALFTPEQQQRFMDIGNAGTVLHEDLNPSGSAKQGLKFGEMGAAGMTVIPAVTGHLMALEGVVAYHAGQNLLSRLMNSPTFVDWLMKEEAASPLVKPTGGMVLPSDPHTGPAGQPNFYSDAYLRSKAVFDAAREK